MQQTQGHRLTSLFIDAFLQIQSSLMNQIHTIRGICVVDLELYTPIVTHTHTYKCLYIYICVHRIYHYIIRTYFYAISVIFKGLFLLF